MKKILLDSKKNFYKANLHCHSVISDGAKTPKEIKEMYMNQGYSIVAYTDHNILIGHNNLSDDRFLALNGYEIDVNPEGGEPSKNKTCHLCLVALKSDNLIQVCYNEKYLFGNAKDYTKYVQYDKSKPEHIRVYKPEEINKIISEGRNNGFFVTYNHPSWSLETVDEYGKYKGMNAMEICNYGCEECGYCDYNEKEYDEMLCGGQKIYCVSTDDNHNYRNDSFGGFTVINAEKLEYETITSALEQGNFYASQGPEIHELWYADGKIGIKCSDAETVRLNTGIRRADIVYAYELGKMVTEAVFDVGDNDGYVRITVTDKNGKHANTNAYFIEDLI